MTTKGRIVDSVKKAGVITFDELQSACGLDRVTLQKILWMAVNDGQLDTVRMIGREDCYYVPSGQTVRFSSVWDYGQRA